MLIPNLSGIRDDRLLRTKHDKHFGDDINMLFEAEFTVSGDAQSGFGGDLL